LTPRALPAAPLLVCAACKASPPWCGRSIQSLGPKVTPIATYRERRFDGRRDFDLHPDRLEVRGKQWNGTEFSSSYELSSLDPQFNRIRARDPGFLAGIGMLIVAVGLLQGHAVTITSYWGGLTAVMGASGLLMSVVTFRKVEWASFKTRAGIDAISVARAGPDASSFPKFLEMLAAQISVSSTNSQGGPAVVA
jgi:hypothetical protein